MTNDVIDVLMHKVTQQLSTSDSYLQDKKTNLLNDIPEV
jgi:hypothetical protein